LSDPVRRFEMAMLRPVQLLILGTGAVVLLRGLWWWLGGCVLGLVYLGIVGSKLHPLQTGSALAQGPLEGPAAVAESAALTPDDKRWLVGQACARMGILVGLALFVVLLGALGWRWYWAVPVACAGAIFSGALLKVVFGTVASGAP